MRLMKNVSRTSANSAVIHSLFWGWKLEWQSHSLMRNPVRFSVLGQRRGFVNFLQNLTAYLSILKLIYVRR